MLAQSFVTVLAAPPHMRGPMLPILPDSCFPGYRTGASGAPEYSLRTILYDETQAEYIAGTVSVFLASAVIFALRTKAEEQGKGRIPGLVFYAYYPLHLTVILLFAKLT